MKKKLSIIALLAWSILTLTALSCNNNTTALNNTIYVDVNGDNSGCTVVSYLDGGRPVSTFDSGTYTNYAQVTNGVHSVSIWAQQINRSASGTVTVNNNSHYMSVYNPCTSSNGQFSATIN